MKAAIRTKPPSHAKLKPLSPALLAKLKKLAREDRTPQWWYDADENPTKPTHKR